MHKAAPPKRKSLKRFEQLNHIVDVVSPTLPSASHVAVLLICYRHAREGGSFTVSTKRIANACRLSERHTKRIVDDLEATGVIVMESEHAGPIPRKYRITGQPANGDTRVTIKNSPPPQANGDI